MMNTVTKIFLSIIVMVSLGGCVKDVDNIKLPEVKAKLVVGCYISPQDSIISVTLSKSSPLGTVVNENLITNAQIIISDDVSSMSLSYDANNKYYKLDTSLFHIRAGKTYHLNIQSPDGLTAKASCTVPAKMNTSFSATIDSTEQTSYGYTNKIYTIRPIITDIPGEANYYRVYADFVKITTTPYDTYIDYSPFYYDYDESICSDHNNDGGNIAAPMGDLYRGNSSSGFLDDNFVYAYLLTIDKNYYEFYRTKALFSEDPFSEPVTIYSNIEGGIGVFAGYQKHKIIIDLP